MKKLLSLLIVGAMALTLTFFAPPSSSAAERSGEGDHHHRDHEHHHDHHHHDFHDQQELSKLVEEIADQISEGVVLNTVSKVVNAEPRLLSQVKLANGTHITVQVPGGVTPEGNHVVVSHQPHLEKGQRLRLALVATETGLAKAVQNQLGSNRPVFSIVAGIGGVVSLTETNPVISQAQAQPNFVFQMNRVRSFPQEYKVSNQNLPLSQSEVNAGIRAGFEMWENVEGASVSFQYAGTTHKQDIQLGDYESVISFVNTSRSETYLAEAHWITDGSGTVLSWDIRFNTDHPWVNGNVYGSFSIQSVLAHEAGHVLGFGHPHSRSELMYAYIPPHLKSLGEGDKAAVRSRYPGTNVRVGTIKSPSAQTEICGDIDLSWAKGNGFWWLTVGSRNDDRAHKNQYLGWNIGSTRITGLPKTGDDIVVKLWHQKYSGADYINVETRVFESCGSPAPTPEPGSHTHLVSGTLGKAEQLCSGDTLRWGRGSGYWWVTIGTSTDPRAYFNEYGGGSSASSIPVYGLPSNSSDIVAYLWNQPASGQPYSVVSTQNYTCGMPSVSNATPGEITAPTPGGRLCSGSTLHWKPGSGYYWVTIGDAYNPRAYFDQYGGGSSADRIQVWGIPYGSNPVAYVWRQLASGQPYNIVSQQSFSCN